MNASSLWILPAALAAGLVGRRAWRRLQLSRAKHPSLAGHARWSRRFALQVPFYAYDESQFFRADDAPPEIEQRRRVAFERLSALYATRYARSVAESALLEPSIPDMQFTSRYRVPFQFRELVRRSLRNGSVLVGTRGNRVIDPDGNESYDLTGSYGVNLFGNDFYKRCMADGASAVAELGAMLGAYHLVMAYNLRRLSEISGHEQASFHMSGTEAVMQAVRVAQYNTGRSKIVRFCGAYHGWWGDVQPGVGNPQTARDTYTLREDSARTLTVLETRNDIACVLVNPLQALHPNSNAPSDSQLIDSSRKARFDRDAYARWLRQLRDVCTRRGIVLIFDEVFVGFRLARGGAQEYFGVKADLVTYGKTLGGGLPVGVVCGPAALMRRYREQRPADICFARGTFNAHPHVMGAMHEFLRFLETDVATDLYRDVDGLWNRRTAALNARLAEASLPVVVTNMGSIWTISYSVPSRYNWMLQYYLRAQGLHLGWIGTGRFIFSLDYTDADFAAVTEAFVAAAQLMQADGWWWNDGRLTNKWIKRRVLAELAQSWWRACIGSMSSPRSNASGARQ
jgi:glutamate-1-semialdehyde 2,1-aminomutase